MEKQQLIPPEGLFDFVSGFLGIGVFFQIVLVVFLGVGISTTRSEPREKSITESRVNCSIEKKLPEDLSTDSDRKSAIVAKEKRPIRFSMILASVSSVVHSSLKQWDDCCLETTCKLLIEDQ